jgi:hypothetical protein
VQCEAIVTACRIALACSLVLLSIGGSALSSSVSNPASGVTTFEDGRSPTTIIHVATDGDDTHGDGSAAHPYRTITRAVEEAGPGTAIRVHAGTYTARTNIANLAGTAEAPIWIGGAPGEPRPVIEGVSEALHLSRVRYVVVHDLEVRNAYDNGINCDDGGDYDDPEATHHVIFRSLSIHDVGGSGNQDCLKLSGVNHFHVLGSTFARCGGGLSGSGIDHVGCHHGVVANNSFETMHGNAIQCKGGSSDIDIRANRMVHAGQRAVNIGGSTDFTYFRPPLSATDPNAEARDIRVVSNVIHGAVTPFAFVGCVGCLAAHNTVVDPESWLLRILQETTSSGSYAFLACQDNAVVNNLFFFDRRALRTYVNIGPNTLPGTFTFSHNLWYAHDEPTQSEPALPVEEIGAVVAEDPLMVDPSAGGYHLQANSPAIGAGTSLDEVVYDFDGRRYNQPPSIGAFAADPLDQPVYLPLVLR